MLKKYSTYLVAFMMLLPACAYAQFTKGLTYGIEAVAALSSGNQTPFWLTANKHGLSSLEKDNGYLSAGIYRAIESNKRFSYGFGLEVAALHGFTSSHVVQQAYADVRYRFWELSVGSKERGSELKNDALSTGGMTFSSNARPVPQVRLSLPDYVLIPRTRGWLYIKGHIAYGRFTDEKFQQNFTQKRSVYTTDVLYHSKSFFLKMDKSSCPLTVEFGLEMAAQFGGDCHYPGGRVISSPHGIGDYLRVIFPMSGGGGSSESDQINIYGNHLGSYNFSVGYRFPEWKVRGYYEHYFDDGSGMMMKYGMWRDCLAGLEVTLPQNPLVTSVVGEFLYTKHQSGAFHSPLSGMDEKYTGADNYYNGQYVGWEHWGQGMGNPLLIAPLYNSNGSLGFRSNRVKAFHLGFDGHPSSQIAYRVLMSFAKHWGTYSSPFQEIKSNKNTLLEVTYSPKKWVGWTFSLAGALDGGDLIGRSQGGMLTIRKTGWIGGRKR